MKKLIVLLSSILFLFACSTQTTNILKQIIGQDPEPPEGYNPVFLSEIKQVDKNSFENSNLIITRVDPYKENKVKLYIHLVEGNNTFLSGATEGNFKKKWCFLIDSVNGKTYEIKDFKIRESNKDDRKPQAIAMVMDHSGSMGDNRAREVQYAVNNFLDYSKKSDDFIALIKYDDSIGVECPLTNNLSEIKTKFQMNGLQNFGRETATLDAIAIGINQLKNANQGLDRIVMVFTDGQDNKSKNSKEDIIALARKHNVMICAIDYGVAIQEKFLESIAQATNGTYNHIYRAKEFNLVFRDIYQRLEKYYEIEYEAPDYGHHIVKLGICPESKPIQISEGTYDNTPYEGLTTILDVNFDTNKDVLKKESYKEIDKMYKMMSKNPNMIIELRGHTDSKGSKEKNLKLSQDRADAVRNELIKRGISPDRITAKGYGDSMPIADNDTESGRAKNRRTEFIVISNK